MKTVEFSMDGGEIVDAVRRGRRRDPAKWLWWSSRSRLEKEGAY